MPRRGSNYPVEAWKEKARRYSVTGLSPTAVYEKIGAEDEANSDTVRYWLDPKRREGQLAHQRKRYRCKTSKKRRKQYEKKYMSRPEVKARNRQYNTHYVRTVRHLDEYLPVLFSDGINKELPLSEIQARLHKTTGFEFREPTLRKALAKYLERGRASPLIEDEEKGLFSLNPEFYRNI